MPSHVFAVKELFTTRRTWEGSVRVDLIFPLREHLEGSSRCLEQLVFHTFTVQKGKKNQLCFTREGDKEAEAAHFVIESQMMMGRTFTDGNRR